MLKDLDLSPDALWCKRFHAPGVLWSQIATQNPTRGIVVTNRDGAYQLYAWDVPAGELRQVTHHATGVTFGAISADGAWLYYHQDTQANQVGHYYRVPFAGGDAENLSPDMPAYASWYVADSADGRYVGYSAANEYGFQVYVMQKDALSKPVFKYETDHFSVGPFLSHDGKVAIVATTERSGGTQDYSLEAFDTVNGHYYGDLWDGNETNIEPVGFATRAGDVRFLATTNRSGFARPLIWNPTTNERIDIDLPTLQGDVAVWDWDKSGERLLLRQMHNAIEQLYMYHIANEQLIQLNHPAGTFGLPGYFSPDDSIFVQWQDSVHPPRLIELDAASGNWLRDIIAVGDPPSGRKWRSVKFESVDETPIQAWLVTPEGDGPFPTIVHTHSGPTSVQIETYKPSVQAWVDHGFAYLSINYRGSITFGHDFQTAINGRLGELEIDDIAAGVQWLMDEGIADPQAIFKTGAAYGGYLTLQALGKRPDLWAGGMAIAAIADWLVMYEDQPESLRGYIQSLFGASPDDMMDEALKASPITYAEAITAPILLIQAYNDPYTPERQIKDFIQRMHDLRKSIHVEWFDAAQSARTVDQQIEHQAMMLKFVYDQLKR